MTAALFPAIMLLVFAIMLLAFCYEPKSEIDPLFAGARPYLSRAQIDRAIEIELHALRYPCLVNRVYARNVRASTIWA